MVVCPTQVGSFTKMAKQNRQTRATQCLAPAVLCTDVDGQCDKLWPMTVTSLPHWPST